MNIGSKFGLREKFTTTLGDPYKNYIALTVFMGLSIMIGSLTILFSTSLASIDMDSILDNFSNIFFYKNIRIHFLNFGYSWSSFISLIDVYGPQYIFCIVLGSYFQIQFLKNLIFKNKFSRTDFDILMIVEKYIRMHDFNKAKIWIEKLPISSEISLKNIYLSILCYSNGETDEALKQASYSLPRGYRGDKDISYLKLLNLLDQFKFSENEIVDIFKKWIPSADDIYFLNLSLLLFWGANSTLRDMIALKKMKSLNLINLYSKNWKKQNQKLFFSEKYKRLRSAKNDPFRNIVLTLFAAFSDFVNSYNFNVRNKLVAKSKIFRVYNRWLIKSKQDYLEHQHSVDKFNEDFIKNQLEYFLYIKDRINLIDDEFKKGVILKLLESLDKYMVGLIYQSFFIYNNNVKKLFKNYSINSNEFVETKKKEYAIFAEKHYLW